MQLCPVSEQAVLQNIFNTHKIFIFNLASLSLTTARRHMKCSYQLDELTIVMSVIMCLEHMTICKHGYTLYLSQVYRQISRS